MNLDIIVILDIAVIIILTVLAYLSKRLGDALKKPPYYKLYYIGIILVLAGVIINTISASDVIPAAQRLFEGISTGLRCVSGVLAVFASLQYWRWLFNEIITF
jgi:hypothetical protein